jgi:hypothetical protein
MQLREGGSANQAISKYEHQNPALRYGPVRYARTGTQTTWWAVKPALRLHGPAVDGFRPRNFRTKKTAHCAAKHPSPDRTANGVNVPWRSTHIREDSRSDDGAMSDAGAMVKPKKRVKFLRLGTRCS